MAGPSLLKRKVFWNKGYYVIHSVYDVTSKILSNDSNYSHKLRTFVFVSRCKCAVVSLQFLIILLIPHTILKRKFLLPITDRKCRCPYVVIVTCFLEIFVVLCLGVSLLPLCMVLKLLRDNRIFHLLVLINSTISLSFPMSLHH